MELTAEKMTKIYETNRTCREIENDLHKAIAYGIIGDYKEVECYVTSITGKLDKLVKMINTYEEATTDYLNKLYTGK